MNLLIKLPLNFFSSSKSKFKSSLPGKLNTNFLSFFNFLIFFLVPDLKYVLLSTIKISRFSNCSKNKSVSMIQFFKVIDLSDTNSFKKFQSDSAFLISRWVTLFLLSTN